MNANNKIIGAKGEEEVCKYLIRKENNKKFDIISLIAKHVHAVKTEFRQFDRPLRGIGAIHFGYR